MERVYYRFTTQDLFRESVRCSLKSIEIKALNFDYSQIVISLLLKHF